MTSLTIAAVGDVMLDRRVLSPRVFHYFPDVSSSGPYEGLTRYPFVYSRESVDWLASLDRDVSGVHSTSHAAQSRLLPSPDEASAPDYPFLQINRTLLQSDIVFGNLECPLSRNGRRMTNDACYAADPVFASSMARAGFRVVSLANNHCLDHGETAFSDTLDVLEENGIVVVGAGRTLEAARTAAVFTVNGVSVAFLAYSMTGPEWVYATDNESGVAPMNPLVAGQDIARIRENVDLVILSVHWGSEGRSTPWPRQVELARHLVDAGADAVLGHHSHVPGSVEVYRGRPILYSLGNFIFGHDHPNWGDNFIARLHVQERRLGRLELIPIRGRYQPAVLNDAAAMRFHSHMTEISARFSTSLRYDPPVSIVDLQP
jgi:poly-gamma-glutamate synthesis protein (capsule biosynthesis protein)